MQAFESHNLLPVFQNGQRISKERGEVIIGGDDKPAGVYLIESGFVKVYSISRSGDQKVHIIYKAGEIFPLIWAIKGTLRGVFYESLTDVNLWRLNRDTFTKRLKADTEFAYAVIETLTESFHIYADRLDNLEYNSAYQRVVYRLSFLAKRFGREIDGGILIDAPLTHQLIADTINLTRETVSRELETLEHKGLLSYSDHQLLIPNQSKLAEELLKFA